MLLLGSQVTLARLIVLRIQHLENHVSTVFFDILGPGNISDPITRIVKAIEEVFLYPENNPYSSDRYISRIEELSKMISNKNDKHHIKMNVVNKKKYNSENLEFEENDLNFVTEEENISMNLSRKIRIYKIIITWYYTLLTNEDLEQSEENVEKIQKILDLATEDETLSLLLNEVDNVILQKSSCNSEFCDYAKLAAVFQTHLDACNQLDAGVSRLMTKLSSKIERLQELKTNEAFDSTLKSPQAIDAKVESLEILMKEAAVEKDRRKIKRCLGLKTRKNN